MSEEEFRIIQIGNYPLKEIRQVKLTFITLRDQFASETYFIVHRFGVYKPSRSGYGYPVCDGCSHRGNTTSGNCIPYKYVSSFDTDTKSRNSMVWRQIRRAWKTEDCLSEATGRIFFHIFNRRNLLRYLLLTFLGEFSEKLRGGKEIYPRTFCS